MFSPAPAHARVCTFCYLENNQYFMCGPPVLSIFFKVQYSVFRISSTQYTIQYPVQYNIQYKQTKLLVGALQLGMITMYHGTRWLRVSRCLFAQAAT
jgi:hypothetical protein